MYGLPPSTIINRPLKKKVVFEKFHLKSAERDRFDADVSRMVLIAYVSPKKIPSIGEGKEVIEFYVLQVLLKHREYDDKNILLLVKLIPQKMVFALQYDGETQFCVFHTRLLQSEWMQSEDAIIILKGLTLDDAWNSIVASIGKLDSTSEESFEKQILHRDEREKLLLQIDALEKRCHMEKQTRKKFELYQQLIKLKEEIGL